MVSQEKLKRPNDQDGSVLMGSPGTDKTQNVSSREMETPTKVNTPTETIETATNAVPEPLVDLTQEEEPPSSDKEQPDDPDEIPIVGEMKADAFPPQKRAPDGWVTMGPEDRASCEPPPVDHHKRPRSPSSTPTMLTPEMKRHRYDVAVARITPWAQSVTGTRSAEDVAIIAPQSREEPIPGPSRTKPIAWPEQEQSPSTPEEMDEFDSNDDEERLLLSDTETLEQWESRTEDEQELYDFYHRPGKGKGKRSK
jgi:hypothetical protein